jgi:hypothetical protein
VDIEAELAAIEREFNQRAVGSVRLVVLYPGDPGYDDPGEEECGGDPGPLQAIILRVVDLGSPGSW